MNEIAKHKATIEDADTQNKVCLVFFLVLKVDKDKGWHVSIWTCTWLKKASGLHRYSRCGCDALCFLRQVSQLYDVVQKWDAMSTSIPQVVQRLVAVKELHEQGNIWLAGQNEVQNFNGWLVHYRLDVEWLGEIISDVMKEMKPKTFYVCCHLMASTERTVD